MIKETEGAWKARKPVTICEGDAYEFKYADGRVDRFLRAVSQVEIIPETVEPSVVGHVQSGDCNSSLYEESGERIAMVSATDTPQGKKNPKVIENSVKMYRWMKEHQRHNPIAICASCSGAESRAIKRDEIIADIDGKECCKDGC